MRHEAGIDRLIQLLTRDYDPRLSYWFWDPRARRLSLRPGRAAIAARRLLGEGNPAIRLLEREVTHAVTASWTALRAAPSHRAEQVSQLRLGQSFRVWDRDDAGDWCLGAGRDGYPGWVRSWHLHPSEPPLPDFVVCRRFGRALAAPGLQAELLRHLSFATLIEARGPERAGFLPWLLPDGREAWTPIEDLEPWTPMSPDARRKIVAWIPRLLGIPYEWGGASAAGFDCSGLVQALFLAAGWILPRDADLQAQAGRGRSLEDRSSWGAGDLLFFGREKIDHVALLMEGRRILHASGEVKMETLSAREASATHPLLRVTDPLIAIEDAK